MKMKLLKTTRTVKADEEDKWRKFSLFCRKSSFKKADLAVDFSYSEYDGLSYYIQLWSGDGKDLTFEEALESTRKRMEVLRDAKKIYEKLIERMNSEGIDNDVKKM